MATYSYKAKTRAGQLVSGVLTAESPQVAQRMLDDRALFPVSIIEGGQASRAMLRGGKRRVNLKSLSAFYSQLADLLRAGVPVLRALDVLSRTTSNAVLAEILKEIHGDVAGGESLADAMAKHPNAFSDLSIAMVRAGEQGGFLEDVLSRISAFIERQDELRNKLIGSMIYPCVLLTAGIAVVTGLMVFVVPRIRTFLDRVPDKPWLTDALFAASDLLKQRGHYALGAVVIAVLFLVPVLRSDSGRLAWDRLKLRLPVLGRIVTMVAICRFCRILGTMLHNGVPILASLKVSKDSAGNRILAAEIERAAESVQKGEPLARPLAEGGLFPLEIIDMIAVAEESNNLESVLVQIADSNEVRTAREIDLGVRLLEPLMLVVMACMVLVIAVALLVPILKMSAAGH